jgi:N-acetyl-gamma-glutamyl-phosphate reductase
MTQQNLRVAVIGASGYGGAELARLLAAHPHAELTVATASGERAGARLSDLFPSLRGVCDIVCEEFDADAISSRADFAFIALGHGKAMDIAPQLWNAASKCATWAAISACKMPTVTSSGTKRHTQHAAFWPVRFTAWRN